MLSCPLCRSIAAFRVRGKKRNTVNTAKNNGKNVPLSKAGSLKFWLNLSGDSRSSKKSHFILQRRQCSNNLTFSTTECAPYNVNQMLRWQHVFFYLKNFDYSEIATWQLHWFFFRPGCLNVFVFFHDGWWMLQQNVTCYTCYCWSLYPVNHWNDCVLQGRRWVKPWVKHFFPSTDSVTNLSLLIVKH